MTFAVHTGRMRSSGFFDGTRRAANVGNRPVSITPQPENRHSEWKDYSFQQLARPVHLPTINTPNGAQPLLSGTQTFTNAYHETKTTPQIFFRTYRSNGWSSLASPILHDRLGYADDTYTSAGAHDFIYYAAISRNGSGVLELIWAPRRAFTLLAGYTPVVLSWFLSTRP
jgi:hypothetical protein